MGFSAYQYQDLLDRQEDLYAPTKYEVLLARLRSFGFSLIPVCHPYSRLLRRPYPVRVSSTGGGLTSGILRRLLRVEKSVPMPVGTSLLLWGARE